MKYILTVLSISGLAITRSIEKVHRSKKNYIVLAIISVFISSCGYRHVIGYSGEKLPESQVAVILTMLPEETEKKLNLQRYPLMYGISEIDGQSFGMLKQSVELLPGKHQFFIECHEYSVKKIEDHNVVSGGKYEEVFLFSSSFFSVTTKANEVYYLNNDRTVKGIDSLKCIKLPIKYTDLRRIDASFKEPGFELK